MFEIAAQFNAYSADSTQSTTVLLSDITNPDKARELFRGRRSAGSIANSKFDSGDHYQNSLGYVGAKPLPGTAGYYQTMLQIQQGFVSENVIKEVTDRHIAGLLGREPLWGLLPFSVPNPNAERRRKVFSKLFNLVRTTVQRVTGNSDDAKAQEADEALTSAWWNTRKVRDTLKKAIRTALLEERATIRFFFPTGLRDANGQIPNQKDLASSLTIPQIEVLTSDKAGIFVDDNTQQEFGVHIYQTNDKKDAACVTYVQDGITFLNVMVDKETDTLASFELGGRLLMYELTRDALITEQVRSLQKSLNLSRTMEMRNINLAGSLERTYLNAEKPKKVKRIADATEALGYREEVTEADVFIGAGASMFLAGMLIRDDAGKVIGRANPNVSFRDPVSPKTFIDTRDDLYAAILSGTFQRFALISGDAAASGRSRIEARSEFTSSLQDTKDAADDMGRWLLETELRLGALLCGRTRDFLSLRCDFNCTVEAGPVSPEERRENREDVKAGILSVETAMSINGREDTDAELARINEQPSPPVQNLPANNSGTGPGLVA